MAFRISVSFKFVELLIVVEIGMEVVVIVIGGDIVDIGAFVLDVVIRENVIAVGIGIIRVEIFVIWSVEDIETDRNVGVALDMSNFVLVDGEIVMSDGFFRGGFFRVLFVFGVAFIIRFIVDFDSITRGDIDTAFGFRGVFFLVVEEVEEDGIFFLDACDTFDGAVLGEKLEARMRVLHLFIFKLYLKLK